VIRSRSDRLKIRDVDEAFAVQQPLKADGGEVWMAQHRCELFRVAMRRDRAEMLTVIGHQGAYGGAAKAVRLLQDRLEHRPRVAGRAVDGVQHLGQRRLPCQRRVALGATLVEFAPEIGDLVVEDHGHLLTPLRAGPSRMLLLILRSDRCTPAARARVDGGK
jgi:hypothetical protein